MGSVKYLKTTQKLQIFKIEIIKNKVQAHILNLKYLQVVSQMHITEYNRLRAESKRRDENVRRDVRGEGKEGKRGREERKWKFHQLKK